MSSYESERIIQAKNSRENTSKSGKIVKNLMIFSTVNENSKFH
jgi:hypothetical protein